EDNIRNRLRFRALRERSHSQCNQQYGSKTGEHLHVYTGFTSSVPRDSIQIRAGLSRANYLNFSLSRFHLSPKSKTKRLSSATFPAVTTAEIIGLSLALLIMVIGFVGSVVPGLPGTPLILIAAIGHRLCFGAHSVSNLVLTVLILLTLGSVLLDYVASVYGAKRFGATWRGAL